MASMSESLVEFVSGGTGPGPPEGVLARALGTGTSPDPKEPARSRFQGQSINQIVAALIMTHIRLTG